MTPVEESATTDTIGEALIYVQPGNYSLLATARGFAAFAQDHVGISGDPNQSISIKLHVGTDRDLICTLPCGPMIWPPMPAESYVLDSSIPLEPLDTLLLRPRRMHKRHFF